MIDLVDEAGVLSPAGFDRLRNFLTDRCLVPPGSQVGCFGSE